MARTLEELLEEFTEELDADFAVGVEGPRFYRWVRDEHPEALQTWLRQRAPSLVSRAVADHLRATRGRVRRASQPSAFQRMAADWSGGDLEAPREFAVTHAVNRSFLRRRVGDMTGPDHEYVARSYRGTGRRHLLLAEFHRQVARRLGDRATREVFDEVTYGDLRNQVLGGEVDLQLDHGPLDTSPPPPEEDAPPD